IHRAGRNSGRGNGRGISTNPQRLDALAHGFINAAAIGSTNLGSEAALGQLLGNGRPQHSWWARGPGRSTPPSDDLPRRARPQGPPHTASAIGVSVDISRM